MKTLFRINAVLYFITLGLYLTLSLGMLAQIVLGIVQVLSAAFIIYKFKGFPKKVFNELRIYFLAVALDGLTFATIANMEINSYLPFMLTLFVFPMLIATFFVHITHKLYKAKTIEDQIDEIDMLGI
ncbi:hypothetical protein ACFQ1M_10960 [Sungkyunkwania multivorans]|uniref:Uncharacterized protein n=1 Tax=Sungkyunkwania multivorans TaxID=1173618 RepID=A0ABW3CY53_9FLAO